MAIGTGTGTRACACSYSNVFNRARAFGTLNELHWWSVSGKLGALLRVQGIGHERSSNKRSHRQRQYCRVGVQDEHRKERRINESFKDYIHQFDTVTSYISHNHNNNGIENTSLSVGGGGPRWFSPLDCSPRPSPSPSPSPNESSYSKPKALPLLLYLPGIDGIGLGLVRHHHRLSQIFEVWCLHIPVMDRTPFSELVKLVEGTVRSEYNLSPNRPIYLLGESVGGCLALAVAAINPHIDLMLILANPATSFDRSNLQLLKPLLSWLPSQCLYGEALSLLKDTVLKRLPQPQLLEDIFESFHTIISYYPVVSNILSVNTLQWKIEMLMTSSAYVNSRLHAIKAPTLILSSGRDILLPSLEEGERLCCVLSDCDIRKFKDNGHFLFLEDDFDLIYTIKGASFYRTGKRLDCAADFLPPTTSEFRRWEGQYNWLLDPATCPVMLSTLENGETVKGLAGIPKDGPTLLVGYHLLTGLELVPLVTSFFEQKDIVLRGMAHPVLFNKPRDARYFDASLFDPIRVMGAVPVSAYNLFSLLASKSHVLLYPGGVRESFHRKGEFYKLFWPEEAEFVRMAAKFGAKIVPFGVVGADDVFELFADYDDLAKIPFIKELIEAETNLGVKLRNERSGEVANQPAHIPIILPKIPGRLYYLFGKPIETAGRRHELMDKQKAQELYIHVKSEVERSLAYLKERREHDPYRFLFPRLLYQSIHGFTKQVPTFEL